MAEVLHCARTPLATVGVLDLRAPAEAAVLRDRCRGFETAIRRIAIALDRSARHRSVAQPDADRGEYAAIARIFEIRGGLQVEADIPSNRLRPVCADKARARLFVELEIDVTRAECTKAAETVADLRRDRPAWQRRLLKRRQIAKSTSGPGQIERHVGLAIGPAIADRILCPGRIARAAVR